MTCLMSFRDHRKKKVPPVTPEEISADGGSQRQSLHKCIKHRLNKGSIPPTYTSVHQIDRGMGAVRVGQFQPQAFRGRQLRESRIMSPPGENLNAVNLIRNGTAVW